MTENIKYSSINEGMNIPRSINHDDSFYSKRYSENSDDEGKDDKIVKEEIKNGQICKSIIPPKPELKRQFTRNQQSKYLIKDQF